MNDPCPYCCPDCGHTWGLHEGAVGCMFDINDDDVFCPCMNVEPAPRPRIVRVDPPVAYTTVTADDWVMAETKEETP